MKKLSLPEFKEYYLSRNFKKTIFSFDNQIQPNVNSFISLSFEFDIITFTFNPNVIYMKSTNNTMKLNRVKAIKVSDEPSLLGTIITVICGDSSDKNSDKEYILIMR